MKEYSKYLTSRNVAILGTISFHAFLFAIFTHINLSVNQDEARSELVINFVEMEEEQVEEVDNKESDDKSNILDEFSDPISNQASNRSSENSVEELRASMKSLDNARDNKEVDLFSEDAENREVPLDHYKPENDGVGEKERKEENSFTGRSTINYYLKDRYSDKLPNPVYTCIDGGKIHIDVEVNQQGRVLSADYNKGKSSSRNECLIETALKYAKRARFNSNFNSPEKQKGYISYNFYKN